MQHLKAQKSSKEEGLIDTPYYMPVKTQSTMSDPMSFQSSISSGSHVINNDLITPPLEQSYGAPELSDFDIIDSLDFDDVDDTLIDQEMMHQQRDALIRQLYETERQYFDKLDMLVNLYIQPLRNTRQQSSKFLSIKKPPCTEKEMLWLFGNLEEIHQFHLGVLKSLDERLNIWGPTQIISDVIQTWFHRLQQLYHVYFDHYDISITTFERLMRYQPFKKFTEKHTKDQSLLSLLRTPITCISRYQKLLETLSDNTSSMHPDYVGLMQCKVRIQTIAEEFKFRQVTLYCQQYHNVIFIYINRIEDTKNVDKVYDILNNMIGQPFNVKAERRLYLQNHFEKVIRLGGEDRSYFLFSDILVFAKKKNNGLQYKGHIVLDRAKVRALTAQESGLEDWSIEITSSFQGVDSLNTTFMSTPTVHVLRTSGPQDQMRWIACIEKLIALLERARQIKQKKLEAKRPGTHSTSNDSGSSTNAQESIN
ncbi:Dbl homology domain-containing protein [Gilbertella persicaria]|uniref:Dbl homology domain-containing protein n=1 Tax=Gilbertella persicaria TaxID=101096 RepID=UPI0022202FD7|nr:Dbl homology domain-containing protein [Gilbertella persicaria]KAI8097995.1 Dbl homology domain-containing protein [Gilbertella persicaria]